MESDRVSECNDACVSWYAPYADMMDYRLLFNVTFIRWTFETWSVYLNAKFKFPYKSKTNKKGGKYPGEVDLGRRCKRSDRWRTIQTTGMVQIRQ